MLLVHGLLNQFGIKLVALLNDISVWWHIVGVLIIVAVLVFAPAHHLSAKDVFTGLFNDSGLHLGWWYIIPVGLLTAQYTFTGYDASAHLTEETHQAATAGPRGIVMSIVVSLGAGWVLLLGMMFALQGTIGGTLYLNEALPGQAAPAQIWHGRDRAHRRQVPAADRDRRPAVLRHVLDHRELPDDLRVLPRRRAARLAIWHKVNQRTRTPTNAIWLGATGALILGLPYLWNGVAYGAVTSIAVIGLYIAYVLPTLLRRAQGANFQRGPVDTSAGGAHRSAGSRSSGSACITILFMLPQFGPVTDDGTLDLNTFNYAVVAVVVVIGYAGIYWLVSARKWFTGPKVQGTPEELAAIERELRGLTSTEPERTRTVHDGSHGSGGTRGPAMLSLEQLQDCGGAGEIDTVIARLHRHAGPPARQAPVGGVLPRRGRCSTSRRAATTCSRWTWT